MKKISLYLIFLFASIQYSSAEIYKVKTDKELNGLQSKLAPGDSIIIEEGNYHDWAVMITASGTKTKPITIIPETIGKVIFSGDVTKTVFKITGNYIVLTGIRFTECKLIKTKDKSPSLIELNNTQYVTINDCYFTKNQVKSQFMPLFILSGNGKYNSVERCQFVGNIDNQDLQIKIAKDNCPQFTIISQNLFKTKPKVTWKDGNGGECIQVGQDPMLFGTIEANTTVQENTFFGCNGESEVISNKSSKNSYLKNNFANNEGELVIRGGHDCIIEGNNFNGGGGIRISGTGHQITNNKLMGLKTAIRLMYGMAKGKDEMGFYIAASNCNITNNLIIDVTTGILIGDGKNTNWSGKFDTKKYSSPVVQNVAPFDNKIDLNKFTNTTVEVKNHN